MNTSALLELLVPNLRPYLEARIDAAIERLNERLAQVPRYEGIWTERTTYARGALVTVAGSLWHCSADRTQERPGSGSDDWILAVKRGKDGRDSTHSKEMRNG